MDRKAIFIILISIIAGLVFLFSNHVRTIIGWDPVDGIVRDLDRMVVEYDPKISSTYKKPYTGLEKELLYARLSHIIEGEEGQTRQTIKTIRGKDKLIEIVREFDKLKSTTPQEHDPSEFKLSEVKHYTLSMCREGRSVSYVFVQNDAYFYEGSTAVRTRDGNMVFRRMPEKLVRLIMSTSALAS